MAISILNNIASIEAQNQLSITQGNLQKTLFQLSSGSRINSGADDAAGLVEIHRLQDIGRNEPIILKRLGDAVDLYGQRDRDSRPF